MYHNTTGMKGKDLIIAKHKHASKKQELLEWARSHNKKFARFHVEQVLGMQTPTVCSCLRALVKEGELKKHEPEIISPQSGVKVSTWQTTHL